MLPAQIVGGGVSGMSAILYYAVGIHLPIGVMNFVFNAILLAIGFKVLPSETNFIFAQPKHDAEMVFKTLKERGFLVRYFKLPRISQYIRITIGKRDDMEAFVKCITEIDK